MIKILLLIAIIISIPTNLYSKDKNSDSIYKNEIKEFDNLIDKIAKDVKKEEKQITFLKTSLINNEISSAKLVVELINKDESFFKILEAKIMMNGRNIYNKKNINKKNITIFNSPSDPGVYIFTFDLLITGAGYGFFTYMKSYKFKVNKTIKIDLPSIGKSKIKFLIYKKGNNTKHPERMLGIKVKE